MNLLLLFESDRIEEDLFRIEDFRAKHLETRGMKIGTRLFVGLHAPPGGPTRNGSSNRGTAVVQALSPFLELRVMWESEAPPLPETNLILAVPRPKVFKRILPQAVTMGVTRLILYRSWRVQRSYLSADILKPQNYRPLVVEGLMQACLHQEPEVIFFERFTEMLAFVHQLSGAKALFHPRAKGDLNTMGQKEGPWSLAFGPEAGLLDQEVESFVEAGFRCLQLRGGILKVETAVIAGLAQSALFR